MLEEFKPQIYPNPFNDYIIIESTIEDEVTFQTIDGKMVLSQQIQIGENKIYTEKLLSGLYVIKFDKQVIQTKLIKQ